MGREYTPMAHQLQAAKALVANPYVGLLMDVGWGKTAAALSAIRALHHTGKIKRVLVIAPKRVCQLVWPREAKEWSSFNYMSVVFLHGRDKDKLAAQDHHIYCVNPDGLQWLVTSRILDKKKFDLLIVDESTAFKHTNTQRFKMLRRNLHKFDRRWIMTGEPVPNGLLDLFGQIYILDLGAALGEYVTHYRMSYFMPAGFRGYTWRLQVGAEERIYDKLRGLICRPLADKKLKLPAVHTVKIAVELPVAAMQIYRGLEKELRALVHDSKVTAYNGAVATNQCRQVTGGALYRNTRETNKEWLRIHDEKLDALSEVLEELQGAPLLVFYEFDHERQRLMERFVAAEFTDKGIGELERAWNRGEVKMLVAHPASVGRGLNLQKACNHVCWFTLPWNLELYNQGVGRVARQGSSGTHVTVYHLAALGTIDEYVEAVLRRKDKTQEHLKLALENL